jgi:hypothetical protein
VQFGTATGIRPIDLVLTRSTYDLRVAIGNTSDGVIVQDWRRGSAFQIENLCASDGRVLMANRVDGLVQAMAGYTATTGLSWAAAAVERPAEVEAILAAYWQPVSAGT